MPFVSIANSSLILAKGMSSKLTGTSFNPLISAVSSSFCTYMVSAPIVTSTNMVLGPGAGTFTAKIVGCVPSAMSGIMMAMAAANGLVGRDIKKLFDAISFGICNTLLSTAMAQGTVIGGGPGMGQGKILNLIPTALSALIMARLAGKKIMGAKTLPLVNSISNGICLHIMSAGTVITTCIGVAAPPPAGPISIPAAPGMGKLI